MGTVVTVKSYTDGPSHTLSAMEVGATITVTVSFRDDAGHTEAISGSSVGPVTAQPNNAAPTGTPLINGNPWVGETLIVDTSGIADADGILHHLESRSYRYSYSPYLPSHSFSPFTYQWRIYSDGNLAYTDIPDANGPTYKPTSDDAGKVLKVRVGFTDDGGNQESLISSATTEVLDRPTEPISLTVTGGTSQELNVSWEPPASNGGSAVTGYTVQWKEAVGSWDTPADVSDATVTGTTYTITGLSDGVTYTVRVFATNIAGDGPASAEATATVTATLTATTTPTATATPIGGDSQQQQRIRARGLIWFRRGSFQGCSANCHADTNSYGCGPE